MSRFVHFFVLTYLRMSKQKMCKDAIILHFRHIISATANLNTNNLSIYYKAYSAYKSTIKYKNCRIINRKIRQIS